METGGGGLMGTSIDDGGCIGMMGARRDAGGLLSMTRVFCELSGVPHEFFQNVQERDRSMRAGLGLLPWWKGLQRMGDRHCRGWEGSGISDSSGSNCGFHPSAQDIRRAAMGLAGTTLCGLAVGTRGHSLQTSAHPPFQGTSGTAH